ncbi:MAG TPA: hypothetical protein VFF65_10275 [Phycisphaerales bacterium]|nr:hypothetical protein [Phycisphaerales bacterium]
MTQPGKRSALAWSVVLLAVCALAAAFYALRSGPAARVLTMPEADAMVAEIQAIMHTDGRAPAELHAHWLRKLKATGVPRDAFAYSAASDGSHFSFTYHIDFRAGLLGPPYRYFDSRHGTWLEKRP